MTDPARKTRAILLSDIKGYSQMMGQDESLALRLLEEHNSICIPIITGNGGTILKFIGDAILASFESASDAVQCGIAVQRALAQRNAARPEGEKIIVRIGIHIGDVVLKDGDAFGDGVNIAARIEPLAEPGGIAISQTVYDMIKARPEIQTVSLGAKELKNIKEAVNIYKVLVEMQQGAPAGPERIPSPSRKAWFALPVLVMVLGGFWILRKPRPPAPGKPIVSAASTPAASAAAATAAIDWVVLPAGSFLMGGQDAFGATYTAQPAHRVSVQAFEISKTEVTFRQYRACVDVGLCANIPKWCDAGDDQPVVCVNWNQAKIFAQWVGARLPTEAEWEYAARSAGKDWKFPWGNAEPSCERAVLSEGGEGCGRKATWPVCSRPKGNTEQGLCDMLGNVREWVEDAYHESYAGAPADGSAWQGPDGSNRVTRSGMWGLPPNYFASAARNYEKPGEINVYMGLRLVRTRP